MLKTLTKSHLLTINLVRLMAYRQIQDIYGSLNHSYTLDEIDAEWRQTWGLLLKNRRYDQAIYESSDLPGMTIIVKGDQVKFEIDDLVGPYIWWSIPKSPSLSKTVVAKMRRSGFIRKHTHLLLLVEFTGNSRKDRANAKSKGDDHTKSEFLESADD